MLRIWENVNIVKNVLRDVSLKRTGAAPDKTFDTVGFSSLSVSTQASQQRPSHQEQPRERCWTEVVGRGEAGEDVTAVTQRWTNKSASQSPQHCPHSQTRKTSLLKSEPLRGRLSTPSLGFGDAVIMTLWSKLSHFHILKKQRHYERGQHKYKTIHDVILTH